MPLKKKVSNGDGMEVSDDGDSDSSDFDDCQEFSEQNEVRLFEHFV